MSSNGFFLTFEGLDGCGKTTQIKRLTENFSERNIDYEVVREPGGTKLGEEIRKILLNNDNKNMKSKTELLLYSASRHQLCMEKLMPLLYKGKVVICDRFFDSTTAYQGYGRGLDISFIKELNKFATNNLFPDLTLFMDISLEERKRRMQKEEKDRLESENSDFHKRVRKGFLELNEEYPGRIKKIDASLPKNLVENKIWDNLKKELE